MTKCLTPLHIPDQSTGRERIVPCGRCDACLVRMRQEWTYRLREEERHCKCSFFITLTYDNENLPIREFVEEDTGAVFYDACNNKKDIQDFNKRLRKRLASEGVKTRFYLISEYGPNTQRPHYHGIYFLDTVLDKDTFSDFVADSWNSPNISVSEVTDSRIKYVTEYCLVRKDIPDYLEPNFRLMSRNPGIGAAYIDKMKSWHLADEKRFYAPGYNGDRCNLPRYYRDKIYPKEVREEHAARLEQEAQEEAIAIVSAPDFDVEKWREEQRQKHIDYHKRVTRFLNKKSKQL